MINTTLTITLPLPHKTQSPNDRSHWAIKARFKSLARLEAKLKTINEMNRLGWIEPPRWKTATVQCTFYKRTKARTDPDNALASAKAFFDGITDSELWKDDAGLTHLPVKQTKDANNPRLEIEVTA